MDVFYIAVTGILAAFGLQTILSRHTCAHRVAELLSICESLDSPTLRRKTSRAESQTQAGRFVSNAWSA